MKLNDIIKIVLDSVPSDWAILNGPIGLQTLAEVEIRENGQYQHRVEVHEHHSRWVLREDVQIGLAFGLPARDGLRFEGLDGKFVHPEISSAYASILFNGQPVHQVELLIVDGGRVRLPMLDYLTSPVMGPHGVEVFGLSATTQESKIAQLVDGLSTGASEFDEYMERTAIVVVPDEA
ncbi:hypothetical protein ACFQZ4_18080 [Catellatospora coxensis]|uniref:Uncharacterized protein n=1 Tax=Catellatospora coxensis TaxID=310354 RepID=A0A8J3PB31_9ACTN|nr:hypothetical protein [Catellatospora coxensis]GIG10008.1 hypothetical protein Cco03nite_67080 [Catellatospora coxensis]